jgi:hypothetical protein
MSHYIVNDVAIKPNILTLNSWLSKHTLDSTHFAIVHLLLELMSHMPNSLHFKASGPKIKKPMININAYSTQFILLLTFCALDLQMSEFTEKLKTC